MVLPHPSPLVLHTARRAPDPSSPRLRYRSPAVDAHRGGHVAESPAVPLPRAVQKVVLPGARAATLVPRHVDWCTAIDTVAVDETLSRSISDNTMTRVNSTIFTLSVKMVLDI